MHHLRIDLVCFINSVIVFILVVDIQSHILVSLSECEVINSDGVGSCEIMQHSIASSDPCVSDEGQEPRYQRQGCPDDAVGESGLLHIDFAVLSRATEAALKTIWGPIIAKILLRSRGIAHIHVLVVPLLS